MLVGNPGGAVAFHCPSKAYTASAELSEYHPGTPYFEMVPIMIQMIFDTLID